MRIFPLHARKMMRRVGYGIFLICVHDYLLAYLALWHMFFLKFLFIYFSNNFWSVRFSTHSSCRWSFHPRPTQWGWFRPQFDYVQPLHFEWWIIQPLHISYLIHPYIWLQYTKNLHCIPCTRSQVFVVVSTTLSGPSDGGTQPRWMFN